MEDFYYLNGRVNALGNVADSYELQKQHIPVTENPHNMVSRNYNCSAVSDMFFSTNNINIIQMGIRNRILNTTQGRYHIGRQSDDELKIIMRSIYFQYSKNLPNNIIEQVRDLNTRVIDWAVPQILTNLKQDEKYRQDISSLPEPLARSELTTLKGTKSLEMKSFI
jgi:hypothetical protein